MRINVEKKEICTGCHSCMSACPKNCISMEADEEGFLYPHIDILNCINCGSCKAACPTINYYPPSSNANVAFAAYSKDEKTRLASSSGGIFSLIANYIIESGGVVFGASFDGNFNVFHTYAETKEEIDKFRGSKYVQSKIGDSYYKVKCFLEQGRLVFFSGTPCQIAGLKSFLKKSYDNLITQDLICHGVPSPLVWEKYLEFRAKAAGSKIVNVSFRCKSTGWKKYSILISFENGNEYTAVIDNGDSNDPFMKLFLKNYCLRPSCYNCKFKTLDRHSDITLADFWGIQYLLPEIDDDKGVSSVIIHTEKGKKLFSSISKYICYKPVDFMKSFNYSYNHSSILPTERRFFMNSIDNKEFDVSYSKLLRILKHNKIKKKLSLKFMYNAIKRKIRVYLNRLRFK